MTTRLIACCAALLWPLLWPLLASAAEYRIDTQDAHAFVQFRIQHLGYSWLWGRFERFAGEFQYDERHPESASVAVRIDTASLSTGHAERDKHLRSDKFLDVAAFPEARFVSTSYQEGSGGKAELKGDLSLHGVTRPIVIQVEQIGHGPDPWGGYRRGFEGRAVLTLADFGIDFDLGPHSKTLELLLSIEGVKHTADPPGPR
jgi:polyisoprenoid-binding protein YceI